MMHDILHESDIYQLILQEGQEKGREEALQRELEDLRQILLSFVRARFPKLVRFATKQISTITDKKTLADLIPKVGLAQTEVEVRQILTEVGKNA
jgi:predicted transposase YdaD